VVEGKVYRSAQPSPEQLAEYVDTYGIRTIINLRGESSGEFYRAQHETARRLGVPCHDVRLTATSLPSVPELRKLIELLETAPKPLLVHCRDGADRTGVASVMAEMAVGGSSFREARDQLSVRYLHIDRDPNHIGELVRGYEKLCRRTGRDPGGWAEYKTWALNEYCPYFYRVSYDVPETVECSGGFVSVSVTITNHSPATIPAACYEPGFWLTAISGSVMDEQRKLLGRRRLPRRDLPPGESLTMDLEFSVPPGPGPHTVRLDIEHRNEAWFAMQGSPAGTMVVVREDANEVGSDNGEAVSQGDRP
jgi:protein tyrosine phosphatase (PTP) superfamily phosphohydrolase (DUF442 family)